MSAPPVRRAAVPADLAGPLDRAVRGLFGVSWGVARRWITTGKVQVAGSAAGEVTARVAAGVEIVVDEQARRTRPGQLEDRRVVHLDAQVVVVDKPAGLATIPYEDAEPDTLEARVRAYLQRRGQSARGARPALGVVHRLDKETSGLLVFTRTWLAKQSLTGQFRAHTVHRRYLAIAHGDVHSQTVTSFFVEDRGDGLRGSARGHAPPGAQRAVTHLERLESLAGATLVACRLETGRTHQIRIHLSEAGHPLLGERVYVRRWNGVSLEAPRLMLHAAELGFVHPSTERPVQWEMPPPEDFAAVLGRLRRR